MRLFFWVVVVGLLVTAIYSGAQGVAAYLQASATVSDAVDLERSGSAQPVQGRWRLDAGDRGEKVRARIVRELERSGLPIDPENVLVSEEEGGTLRVQLRWLHPLFVFRGEQYLLVPVSLTRTFDLSGAARAAGSR